MFDRSPTCVNILYGESKVKKQKLEEEQLWREKNDKDLRDALDGLFGIKNDRFKTKY